MVFGLNLKIFMKWLINKILQAWDARTVLKVLVHEAIFVGQSIPFYFIKVINCSPEKVLTITHIWVEENRKKIHILSNPLPYTLDKSDVWETWIAKELINDHINIFKNFRVMLSDGKICKSKKNLNVPSAGFVANK